jgi:hypothetical protein
MTRLENGKLKPTKPSFTGRQAGSTIVFSGGPLYNHGK